MPKWINFLCGLSEHLALKNVYIRTRLTNLINSICIICMILYLFHKSDKVILLFFTYFIGFIFCLFFTYFIRQIKLKFVTFFISMENWSLPSKSKEQSCLLKKLSFKNDYIFL